MKRDLVCGRRVGKDSEHVVLHEGRTYYFDCQACKATFCEDPKRYLKKKRGEGFLKWLAKGSSN